MCLSACVYSCMYVRMHVRTYVSLDEWVYYVLFMCMYVYLFTLSIYFYEGIVIQTGSQPFTDCSKLKICTGLIKSNRPPYVSVSHKHGIRLSDSKFLRCIAHVINILLTEFQIRTMLHIASMTMWTSALFAVQIQICQLVVTPRNLAGCGIYEVHVSSIACFIIIIFNTTFVTKNCTLLLKITKFTSTELELIGSTGGLITATYIQ